MTKKSLSLALILAALTLSTVASCGGDDEGGDSGAGGTAGAGAGGTSGAGGSGASSGAGGASGTSSVGGSSGAGGASGTSGTGGAGGAGAGGAGAGGAGAGGAGGEGGMGMNGQVCPATQPANGETCEPARGDCDFGDNVCDCVNDSDTWVCWNPATDCPEEAPVSQSACPTVGIECEYGQGMNGNECDCSEDGWECDDEDFGGEDGGV